MRIGWLNLAAVLFLAAPAAAQDETPRHRLRLDAAGGAGSSRQTLALSLTHQIGLFRSKRLSVGYGLRYSLLRADRLGFRTSDRDQLMGRPVDRVSVKDPRVHSINAAIHGAYLIGRRIEVGLNIDAVGVSFGPARTLTPESTGGSPGSGTPTDFNLLQGGARDRGTLDSEFYVAIRLSPRVSLRGGLSHYVAEYTTDAPLDGGSDRVRSTGNLFFGAVSYRWR